MWTDIDEWIPDSDASSHISGNSFLFNCLTQYDGGDSVMVGNGQALPFTHTGNVVLDTISGPFQLNNVLFVPDLKQNFISITQLSADLPCDFHFCLIECILNTDYQEN